MNKSWRNKREKTRRRKKNNNEYTFWDLIVDVLLWIPELILFPVRILVWMFRSAAKMIGNMFDVS